MSFLNHHYHNVSVDSSLLWKIPALLYTVMYFIKRKAECSHRLYTLWSSDKSTYKNTSNSTLPVAVWSPFHDHTYEMNIPRHCKVWRSAGVYMQQIRIIESYLKSWANHTVSLSLFLLWSTIQYQKLSWTTYSRFFLCLEICRGIILSSVVPTYFPKFF